MKNILQHWSLMAVIAAETVINWYQKFPLINESKCSIFLHLVLQHQNLQYKATGEQHTTHTLKQMLVVHLLFLQYRTAFPRRLDGIAVGLGASHLLCSTTETTAGLHNDTQRAN